jgi:hypothetical protein
MRVARSLLALTAFVTAIVFTWTTGRTSAHSWPASSSANPSRLQEALLAFLDAI